MPKFASYVSRVLVKSRLILSRTNGLIMSDICYALYSYFRDCFLNSSEYRCCKITEVLHDKYAFKSCESEALKLL